MEALHWCAAIRNEFEDCLSASCTPRVPRVLRLHDGPLFARFALHGTERSINSTRETRMQTANVSCFPLTLIHELALIHVYSDLPWVPGFKFRSFDGSQK